MVQVFAEAFLLSPRSILRPGSKLSGPGHHRRDSSAGIDAAGPEIG